MIGTNTRHMNVILVSLLMLAAFIVLKFSKLPGPSFFPKFLTKTFERPPEESATYDFLRILENLSLAYITALLIYLLVEVIPQNRLERKAFTICRPKIVNIYLHMSRIVGPLKMLLNIKKENETIVAADLTKVSYYPHMEKIYYSAEIYLSDKGANGSTKGIFLFHRDLSESARTIQKNIDAINSLPSSTNLSEDLVNILSLIRSNSFVEQWSENKGPWTVERPYELSSLEKPFYDLIQLYLQLEAFNFRKHSYVYTKMDEEDILKLKKEKQVFFDEMKDEFSRSSYKFYHNSIEYRVEDGQLVE